MLFSHLPRGGGFKYPYPINQSCMFDLASSSYMTGPADGVATKFTFSFWVKRTKLSSDNHVLFAQHRTSDPNNQFALLTFNSDDKLTYVEYNTAYEDQLVTSKVFRDCASWYHIVVIYDSAQATEADRIKIYVNGTQVADFDTANYPTISDGSYFWWTSSNNMNIGRREDGGGPDYPECLLAEIWLINNQALAASNFGKLKNGIWVPIAFPGTVNSEDVHLDFADSGDLGNDVSGNANDFTPSGMGTDHKVFDSPTKNYCTLDFNAVRSNITAFTEGGMHIGDAGGAWHSALGTFLPKTGKWYWEISQPAVTTKNATGILAAGELSGDIITADQSITAHSLIWAFVDDAVATDYIKYNNDGGTADTNLAAPANDDVMIVAFDADANKLWFGVDGTWANFGAGVGDPAAGTNPAYSNMDSTLYDLVPFISVWGNITGIDANFGQRPFTYTPPIGFKALCTKNLPEPRILESNKGTGSLIYTGDGEASHEISDLNFQADLAWIKNRDALDGHQLYDSIRGATKVIKPHSDQAEEVDADGLLSFDGDGFTVGADVRINTDTEKYVAWCLRRGARFGFDMVSYTGTGAAHAESHNLGVSPELMLVKNLDAARAWAVYHHHAPNKSTPEDYFGVLNTAGIWTDLDTVWNDTAPTASQFTVGTHISVNSSGEDYIAYLFSSIPGFSKVFSFEGNNNAAGPYIHLGFKPEWLFFKNADSGASWWGILDAARRSYNVNDNLLNPNEPAVESYGIAYDFLSNGIKIRSVNYNANDVTFVGIAFAKQPFKYANAN